MGKQFRARASMLAVLHKDSGAAEEKLEVSGDVERSNAWDPNAIPPYL
jgi:hypothetical protein